MSTTPDGNPVAPKLDNELSEAERVLSAAQERLGLTSSDLLNVIVSMDIATLVLDRNLHIRFFTPATKWLFNIIPSDVGRPLSDLSPLAPDAKLASDARSVFADQRAVERDICAQSGHWFARKILPYNTRNGDVAGVVITFVDITERKRVIATLESEKSRADSANGAKSRFLAAASHDLRQPLQALKLVQGMLSRIVEGEGARQLVDRLDDTLGSMATMLNALLDINQIEAGTVHTDITTFPVSDLFDKLRDDLAHQARAQGLQFTIVQSKATIRSDQRLVEQMLRNLLSNAFKYAENGRVLLGCRHRAGILSVEVWDTGMGIPDRELTAIFEEYHQLDNPARERHRGLGLGLSIVKRLGILLGHVIRVKSVVGKGSVFAIDMSTLEGPIVKPSHIQPSFGHGTLVSSEKKTGAILIVEDDDEVRDLLSMSLQQEGHRTLAAVDGVSAVESVARGAFRPDLILADYNLPNGLNGLQTAAKLRAMMQHDLPVIILTGDISTSTLREISLQRCVMRHKPVKAFELTEDIQRILFDVKKFATAEEPTPPLRANAPLVFLVDDDDDIRALIRTVLENDGLVVRDFSSCESFLSVFRHDCEGCLLVDAYLPGMSGLDLLRQLKADGCNLPAVMITGSSDVAMAVEAMKAGAIDFIEKPLSREALIECVMRAFHQSRNAQVALERVESASAHMADLTPRQRQIMEMVLAGQPSKIIAANLNISQRTVENHRATIMKKTGSRSLPALARLALASGLPAPAV